MVGEYDFISDQIEKFKSAGTWCNGNTLVFKTENRGSIPLVLVSIIITIKR